MNCEDALVLLKNNLVPSERKMAAEFLLNSCEPSEYIIEALTKSLIDNDKGVQDVISTGLAKLTKEPWNDITSAFLIPYFYINDLKIKNLAAEIILKIRPKDLNPLIQLFYGINPDNVEFAIHLFGKIAGNEYLDILTDKLSHTNVNVRISVVDAIGNIVENNPVKEDLADEIVAKLNNIYEYDVALRPHIINTIGQIGSKKSEEFLFNIIHNEKDFFLKLAAIDSLASCGNDLSICYTILNMIESVNDELKIIFLKTIYAIANRLNYHLELPDHLRYIAHLALLDNNPDVYGAGLIALGNIFRKEDARFVLSVVFRNDHNIQQYILRVLIINSPQETIEEFIKQFFLKFDLTDSENLDFLSYITVIAPEAPIANSQTLIKSIIKNTIIQKPVYWASVIQYCFEISFDYAESQLRKFYEVSDIDEREFLNNIFTKFDINL
jgi:HEAT repeat protein